MKSFITIGINSVDESIHFYTEVLGFKVESRVKPTDFVELIWLKNENSLIVELVKNDRMPPPDRSQSSVTLTFQFENLKDKVETLNNFNIEYNYYQLPNGLNVYKFKDPDGVSIAFMDF